ncbi:MAG TPA: hypothetical protein VJH88_04525 [Candidatus Nanoarchaeia archaeon]|nr:hypothetical protein [Candidatus Nanoarchaeia archaeon]
MRDKSHADFEERWVKFVKRHPTEWQKHHAAFINGQFQMAWDFIERLSKQPGGKEKIREIYGITNMKAYPKLLG